MNVLDAVLLAFLAFGLIRGFWRGFFVEIASLLALVAGVYGAFHFSAYASEFLKEKVDWNENSINIVAFFGTLILIILAIGLAGKALTKIADFAALGLINKLLGAFFGGLKVAVILSVLLIVFEKMNKNIFGEINPITRTNQSFPRYCCSYLWQQQQQHCCRIWLGLSG